MNQKSVLRFSLIVLLVTMLVILWGALVRATGSGAGCGEHWPLCNGTVVPFNGKLETLIEFGHRASSGVSLVLVLSMAVAVFRWCPTEILAKKFAKWSVVFIFGEAAVGALLVLQRLVGQDASLFRAVVIALHLINSYLLLAAICGVVWALKSGRKDTLAKKVPSFVSAAGVTLLLLGATGAIVALGDTLFPAASLAGGFAQDLNTKAHFLIRLRAVHPAFAVITGIYLVVMTTYLMPRDRFSEQTLLFGKTLSWLVLAQIGVGVLNLSLLAPLALQLAHLLLADTLWLAFVVMYYEIRYGIKENILRQIP